MHGQQLLQVEDTGIIANRRMYSACKRIVDLVLSVVILIIMAPVMMLVALAIKLDSPGPALFSQVRIGKGGRPFKFYKFRTMHQDSDCEMHRSYVLSFINGELWDCQRSNGSAAPFYKLAQDPRVTRVGRILRQTSIDELPQLFNVVKGEMSLVGPRPALPYEVREYKEWHRARLAVIPGITGYWQVRGRSQVSFEEMVRMDLIYIGKQSLWLDLRILILTIPAVISGKGAA